MPRERRSQKRPQKEIIFIFTEGETEYNYFDQIKKELVRNHMRVSVELSRTKEKTAIGFIRYAREVLNHKLISPDKNDRIFCVFDMDTAIDEDINRAMKIMPRYMRLIVSNPDFELWFLLHYEYRTSASG